MKADTVTLRAERRTDALWHGVDEDLKALTHHKSQISPFI